MDWYGMMDILTPLLATLLVTLVSWGVYELKKFVKVKTDNELLLGTVDVIGEAANAVVADLNATLKKEMEEAGPLTKESAAEIKAEAMSRVKAMLSTQTTKVASKVIVDLDTFISGKLEEGVIGAKITPSP